MQVFRRADQMADFSSVTRKSGKRIAFVPTMGALHEGHCALFREAKKHADVVVASIYVNPRQFNDPQDFKKYARDLEGDLKKCEKEGVDAVFAPTDADIYPAEDTASEIPVPEVASRLEGASRPGHFDGVVAVVSRLFRIVKPHIAVFGLKDYQQVRVIEEMVKQQKMNVAVLRHPTVREKDGLAMSSRNVRLTPAGRKKALFISKSLKAAQYLFEKGERDTAVIRKKVEDALVREGITVDYVAVVDPVTLCEANPASPVREAGVQGAPETPPTLLIAVAAFVDEVRLIDNGLLG